MKKLFGLAAATVVAAVMVLGQSRVSEARPPYWAEFEAKYVKTAPDSKFATDATAAKCNVCHVGKEKKDRNSYGQALSKLLTKADAKNKEKINAALDTVAGEPSTPGGPTFGELIKEGKLPGK